MKTFRFDINYSVDLTEEQIWPDGDAPEDPTEEDVRNVFMKCARKSTICTTLEDWGIDPDSSCLSITDVTDSNRRYADRIAELKERLNKGEIVFTFDKVTTEPLRTGSWDFED